MASFAFRSAALAVVTLAAAASAQLTREEHACQQAVSKQAGTFLGKKIKCLVACDKRALGGKVPPGDCLPPFAGATAACVAKAEVKALEGMLKKCGADCPECYAGGGDCGLHAGALVGGIEQRVDLVVPVVVCDDTGSPDGLTRDEGKVRQKVALVVAKFIAGSEKCLAKCRKREAAGTIDPGGCVANAETDPTTIGCLVEVGTTALEFLEDPELDTPECLQDELAFTLPIAQGLIGDFDPLLFCASPSAAFVSP